MSKKVPVLVLAFNRADHVTEAMKAIREYKPERLYLECDGARLQKEGEKDAVEATRKAMLNAVDWDCEVKTLFRDKNLGCANAVYDAISWFFENEEYGIICEDDIILSQDFFKLCEDLLPRYKDDNRIFQIAAQQYNPNTKESNTYTFQKKTFIWGWATWRRAWLLMDMQMTKWPQFKMKSLIPYYGFLQTMYMYKVWNSVYHNLSKCTSWATRWHFACISNNMMCICANVNLSINIGCTGEDGAHYNNNNIDPYSWMKIGSLKFPLSHPSEVQIDKIQIRIDNKEFWRIRMIGLKKRFLR